MTQEGPRDGLAGRCYRPRHADRRHRGLQPPPYRTAGGPVDCDRRSHLDRRADWIRDYVLHDDDGDDLN